EKKVPTKMIALLVAPPEPKFAELGEACIGVVGSSQWEPMAKYTPEAAKAENIAWFGPTVPEFLKLYAAKYGKEEPSYHSAGGYAAGLILQKAIETAGSIDTEKVKAAIDKEDMYTFYGRIKFNTGKLHGLQEGHEMIYIQWQKDKQGKPEKVAVYPPAAATGSAFLLPAR
ncbi:MAG: ABC transporter substrate-binding protein, partial [Desulfobaccales bacterium]